MAFLEKKSDPSFISTDPLKTPVRYLKGVGPYISDLLAKKGILTVEDLLFFLPYRYLDRRRVDTIREVQEGCDRTIVASIVTCGMAFGRGRRKIYEMIITDGTGVMEAKWFHFNHRYMLGVFKKGMTLLISGEVTLFRDQKQFIHPDIQILETDSHQEASSVEAPGILPLYSNIQGMGQKTIRKIIHNAISSYAPSLPESLPPDIVERLKLPSLRESLEFIHQPNGEMGQEDLDRQSTPFHRRLKFEELFYLQLGLALKKKSMEREKGISFSLSSSLADRFKSILPFELTAAQRRVINQISLDMQKDRPMNRLLQGDVGSGKTIVALLAACIAMDNGYQAALMVPTEILAEQHYNTLRNLLKNTSWQALLLTSRLIPNEKKKRLLKIEEGTASLVIGTHALIQEGVNFKNLGLVIIDEQHRFGVLQRAALKKKGVSPDILIMTATPIPRTLAMTLYGDLDFSIIDEMPPGRPPIVTRVVSEKEGDKIFEVLRQLISQGEQVFIVYPLIEESEKLDLKNATDMARHLQKDIFTDYRVALLHGRMDSDEKERIIKGFKEGEIQVLVSTTIIEVGIDIPNATCMVIEHAERFGLSQLHQLRGRIGRGEKRSYCYLIHAPRMTLEGRQRLKVMEETRDGFKIAEEDLNIRGPGDFMGTRQWGLPDLKFAHLVRDASLLAQARELAFAHIESDPTLEGNASKYLNKKNIFKWYDRIGLKEIA